ncbi:uncharacterized protein LOC100575983 [Acyrthosiphon pisum]|uniref:Uncharacterized protein n=1 Tax=Acyrthosiphon pisum TaxID=7029 RepID=A0A8R2D6D0_ACYPI|nr:uncharacterized protein LOC100575983 [Acyrthosiphon pisum]|eukprot:XP_016663779.1 PREDICTED: uncharacterized protein LOC100575983 [Acyrthosiphon pisum]
MELDPNPVFSQDAQPLDWLLEDFNNEYGAMTQSGDSGYLSRQESLPINNWHRDFSSPIHEPSPPQNTPPPPKYNAISSPDLLPEFEVSNDSPNMLIPHAPIRLHHPSPTFGEIQFTPLQEHENLIFGELNTTQNSVEMDWSDDGYNEQFYRLMENYEGWGSDFDEINELFLKKHNK